MESSDFNYNILLKYLSYKKYGTWQDFKKYVENLSYDDVDDNILKYRITELSRTLSALGHVEFLFGDKNFYAISPPTIALFENSFTGVLCGYRTFEFLDSLIAISKEFGISYQVKKNFNAPSSIIIDFKNQELLSEFQKKYDKTFIKIVQNFSLSLLKNFPSINTIIKGLAPIQFNRNEANVKLFNRNVKSKFFQFETCRGYGERESYVYESSYISHRDYIIYYNENYYKMEKSIALCKYFSEHYNKVVQYNSDKTLEFSHSLFNNYIPELIDRALTLSSGFNREIRNDKVIYGNISLELARMVSEKTGLYIKEHYGA